MKGVAHTYRTEQVDEKFVLGPLDLTFHRGELVFIVYRDVSERVGRELEVRRHQEALAEAQRIAKVGSVKDVTLTRDNKARIEMEVDRRFAPFRSDADCTIQPQSLIGEKFVQCTPGTPRASPPVSCRTAPCHRATASSRRTRPQAG